MKDRFQGWRGRCGLTALLSALFFTAAWAKTAVDLFPFGANISVSAYGDSSPGDTTFALSHWNLSGLFSDLSLDIQPSPQPFVFAAPPPLVGSNPPALLLFDNPGLGVDAPPPQVVSNPPAGTPGILCTESAEPTNFVMQTAASEPGPASVVPTPQGSLPINFSEVEECDSEQDRGKLKSEWKCCGIEFEERESEDFGREVGLTIPHWTIALPCALVAVALLFGPRRRSSKIDIAANPVQPIGAGNQTRNRPFFAGWRPKLGVLTLLPALALAGGWIRSFVVTDAVHFDIGTEMQIRLHSAKDGLVCERYLDPNYVGSGFFYWTLTGEAHNRTTFRPRMHAEFSTSGGLPLQTFGSVSLPSPGIPPMPSPVGVVLANSESGEPAVLLEDLQPAESVSALTGDQPAILTGGPTSPPMPLPASIVVHDTPKRPRTFDTVVEGGGIFLFYSPTNSSTFVVPYAYLVIPLTLLSAWLLLRHRVQPALAR